MSRHPPIMGRTFPAVVGIQTNCKMTGENYAIHKIYMLAILGKGLA